MNATAARAAGAPDADFVLETHDLSKEFRGFVAVSGVNLRVRTGRDSR